MTTLSININKFALVRNSRGENNPDICDIAKQCIAYGAHGITVHPRPDERHITYQDVRDLKELLNGFPKIELNVEGYPSDRFIDLIFDVCPDQVTLVPDPPEALTSSYGWDVCVNESELSLIVLSCKENNIRSSLFIDPTLSDFEALMRIAPDRIEHYTYNYAHQFAADSKSAITPYKALAEKIALCNIEQNAGHDLNQQNLAYFLSEIPHIKEVSIGHALVCDCFQDGLKATIENYLACLPEKNSA